LYLLRKDFSTISLQNSELLDIPVLKEPEVCEICCETFEQTEVTIYNKRFPLDLENKNALKIQNIASQRDRDL